jgi:transposase InsO family protein
VTTDSHHPFAVYPNLAAGMKLTDVNQLWVADITYIRLLLEFVYLAVILDAFSRRGVGWALGRSLEMELTLQALRMALRRRRPAPGLVHHSDRGVQYAANDYIDMLSKHGIGISMSRRGNPWDNAICESFMKTLKYEQVYREDYRVFEEAEAGIEYFIDDVYNEKRLHSALGFLPPAEFEASLRLRSGAGARA